MTGATQSKACEIIGITPKTIQRWKSHDITHDRRKDNQQTPKNKLTDLEKQRMLNVINDKDYAHLPPNQIVPALADLGIYLASESTFYRVLKEKNLLIHRNADKPRRNVTRPQPLVATGPNQVYTWDITYLPTRIKGLFFYLYMVMDIYSRKIVGWQVHDKESSALAADLMTDICQREGIEHGQVVLHSDNGSPMKGATMLATLQELGIMPSLSRPSVSNDNPYSESLFKTLKYRPEYPERAFENITAARCWVEGFVSWYNTEHRHSGIKLVTPEERHTGKDIDILAARVLVYKEAKKRHPERWSGDIKNMEPVGSVYLNPSNVKAEGEDFIAA